MTTLLLAHPDCHAHLTPPGHPESPARLTAIEKALAAPAFDDLLRREAPPADGSDLALAHPPHYVRAIAEAVPAEGFAQLDADTWLSPGSWQAALRAAGAVTAAVDAVLAGEVANAFCAIRPPGHHAEREKPMGFCIFGNVAIGALHALERHGLERVAIFDFDVHHGNGTQAILWDEPRIRFVSTHQMPLWPGTGAPAERGAHDNIRNVPLAPLSDGAAFRAAVRPVLDWLDAFAPELVLVSAGFDAHAADPLANLALIEEDFAWITRELAALARRHAGGRLVSTLEGGYALSALAQSVAAHVATLMEEGARE